MIPPITAVFNHLHASACRLALLAALVASVAEFVCLQIGPC